MDYGGDREFYRITQTLGTKLGGLSLTKIIRCQKETYLKLPIYVEKEKKKKKKKMKMKMKNNKRKKNYIEKQNKKETKKKIY